MRLRMKHLTRTAARFFYLRLPRSLRIRVLVGLLSLDRSMIVVPLLAVDPLRADLRPMLVRRIRDTHGDDYELTPHGVAMPLSKRYRKDEQSRVLAEIVRVMDEACRTAGLSVWWIAYGTLLGIVRDNALLPADDDLDVAYVSMARERSTIVLERRVVLEALRTLPGVDAHDLSGGVFSVSVRREGLSSFEFDLFTAYETERGLEMFMAPPGIAETDWVLPTQKRKFLDATVPVPNDPEAVLAWLYGEGWSVPDPSYRARWFWPEHDFLRREKLR